MTKEECKQLIMVCESIFPQSKNGNPIEKLNAWYIFLQEYDYKEMLMALKIFVSTSNSAFAPSVSELIAMTRKPKELSAKIEQTNNQYDEVATWREVRQAIKNGIYGADEEFAKLSPIAQRMVGDAQQIREWAMLESQTIDSVIQSNFKNRFNDFKIAEASRQKRQTELQAMPIEVQALIQKTIEMKKD